MAREALSERGLPSPEVRRQILQHAGMILHEARELMEQLDRHETAYPRTVSDPPRLIWLKNHQVYPSGLSNQLRAIGGSVDDATPQYQSGHALAT